MHGKLSQITLTKFFLCLILIIILLSACINSFIRAKNDLMNHHLVFKLNQLKKINDYQTLIQQIDSSNPRTDLLAGNIALRHYALLKAKKYYIMGLKQEPNNPFLWVNFALVLTKQKGQKKQFQNAVKMAKKYGGNHPEIKLMLKKLLKKFPPSL